jgi:hypothetical protein
VNPGVLFTPNGLTNVNGTLSAFNCQWVRALKATTAASTVLVKDIIPARAGVPRSLTNLNGTLLFTAANTTGANCGKRRHRCRYRHGGHQSGRACAFNSCSAGW